MTGSNVAVPQSLSFWLFVTDFALLLLQKHKLAALVYLFNKFISPHRRPSQSQPQRTHNAALAMRSK